MAKSVFENILVVEFGKAAALCGRILADGGARVILIDDDTANTNVSVSSQSPQNYESRFYNGGKHCIAASSLNEEMRDKLLDAADVVLDGDCSQVEPVVDPGEFCQRNARSILVTIRPYGLSGPYSRYPGTDLTAFATGGIMYVSGKSEGPPVTGPGRPAFDIAALEGAVGILVALLERETSGLGQHIEISAQEALASLEHLITRSSREGAAPPRRGSKHESVVPARIYQCADGWIQIFITARADAWEHFYVWLGSPAELSGSEWSDPMYRRAHDTLVDEAIERSVRSRNKAELSASALAWHIPCYPVNSLVEYLADPQTVYRDLFRTVKDHRGTSTLQLRLPPLCEPQLLQPRGESVNSLFESNDVLNLLPTRLRSFERSGEYESHAFANHGLPLKGLRVVDMTQAVAGSFSTRFLADFGADVIKLESYSRPDGFRTRDGGGGSDATSAIFANLNRNKRGVALDLKDPKDYKVAKAIIAKADLMVENFAPGVLERLGLSWDVIHELNPGLIMVRLSGLGQSGPLCHAPAWGLNMQAFCGMTYLWNMPDDPEPVGTQTSISDYLLGFWGTISGLLGIYARNTDFVSEGLMVDVAQAEAGATFIGEFVIASAEGNDCTPHGNSKAPSSPMGVFRLHGHDRWCALEVRNDHEWRTLFSTLDLDRHLPGAAEWQRNERQRNASNLDKVLTELIETKTWEQLSLELQQKVPLSLVHDGIDLLHCQQLVERGFIVEIPQTGLEDIRYPGIVIKMSRTPASIDRRSPLIGEHTDQVIQEWNDAPESGS